jgi:ubiquinol-cytochrome c reductase cytochrome c1 subunit
VQVREGLHYNPYFPGGAIAMPQLLNDGGVEYDDGTPASASQQAKVCCRVQLVRTVLSLS